jgi:hypothetical protein
MSLLVIEAWPAGQVPFRDRGDGLRARRGLSDVIGVGVLDVPFTFPAASAKTLAWALPLHVPLPPALLEVALVR